MSVDKITQRRLDRNFLTDEQAKKILDNHGGKPERKTIVPDPQDIPIDPPTLAEDEDE